MSRTFSQEEVDYILSFMDKSTDYCQSKEDYQFDEAVRKKLDTLKSEPTTSDLVDELRKREGVEAFDVSVNGDSRIVVWEREGEKDDGSQKGPAIILRIID